MDRLTYKIVNEFGHWTVYVDGKFFGSYDSYSEASTDIDHYVEERKGKATA